MNINIPYNIQKLETEPRTTTNQSNEYDISEEIPFNYTYDYLYHGIRFQTYLERLESIFRDKAILAGKHIKGYNLYSDNCNKGEYVSLFKHLGDNQLEYQTFIIESIVSLLVTPLCNAIETKYVDYNTWLTIQTKNLQLKNIYSYMRGECMCKDFVHIEMVKAIGVPYQYLVSQGKKEYIDKLIEDIKNLMKQYSINLPIVDTSRYNLIITENIENTKQKKLKSKTNLHKQ